LPFASHASTPPAEDSKLTRGSKAIIARTIAMLGPVVTFGIDQLLE
jgi:hypothetical protein